MDDSDELLIGTKVAAIALNLGYAIGSRARQRRLGALLLRTPVSRWLWVFLILGVTFTIISYRRSQPLLVLAVDIGFWFSPGINQLFLDRFSVHEGGIAGGTTAIPWSKLEGWAWESPSMQLSLWAPRSAIYCLPLPGIGCWKTTQGKTDELEMLLQRFAPEQQRASQAGLSPASTH